MQVLLTPQPDQPSALQEYVFESLQDHWSSRLTTVGHSRYDRELNILVSKGGLEPPRPCERRPLKPVRLPIPPLRRVTVMLPTDGQTANKKPNATTVVNHVTAKTVVMRLRFRSAAAEPIEAPPAPPNMSDRPPP